MSACDRCLALSELTLVMASVAEVPESATGATPAALIRETKGAGKDRVASVEQHWGRWEADRVRESGAANGMEARCRCDPAYPEALRPLTDEPPVLWIRGAAALIDRCPLHTLGIVGTRRPSLTGRDAARRIAAGVTHAGGLIVSGMALGIDAAAHQGALSVGGPTVAVLASGADMATPQSNGGLYEQILERGAIVSEMPPGTRPQKWGFPARNRIIAALSEGTLVVEAPLRSGALITVTHATDMGRSLYAVPGSLASDTCEGSNRMLVDGAGAVLEASDLTSDLGLNTLDAPATPSEGAPAVVHEVLKRRPLSMSEVERAATSLGPGEVELALLDLELAGWVSRRPDGRYTLLGSRAA